MMVFLPTDEEIDLELKATEQGRDRTETQMPSIMLFPLP